MDIKYRRGVKKDSDAIAQLINIASDGVLEYMFHDLVPDMTPVEMEAEYLKKNVSLYSYKSTIVAAEGKKIAGIALSFPSSYHDLTEEMMNFLPFERIKHLEDFFTSRVENSWYLDALGVFDKYRNLGIGKKLLLHTKDKAIEKGFKSLSLIVFADNKPALHLYKSFGFDIVQKVKLKPNHFIKHKQGCLLLKCNIL